MSALYPLVALSDVARLDPDDTLVLSVNNRHARRILGELSASLGANRQVMAVPDIVPLSAWLMQAADHLSFHSTHDLPSHTADSFGTAHLWRRVIDDVESEQALLDVAQAARLAAEADRLLDDWRIAVHPDEQTADFQRFMAWRERYRAYLDELDLEDGNQAYERVCRAVSDGRLQRPVGQLVLAGFNEVSPRLRDLLNAMQEQGSEVFILDQPSTPAAQVQRVQASDGYAEWTLAAQWARDQLTQDPNGRYAIVAPKLEGGVALAHRVLRQTVGAKNLPFNIAVGRPLAEWPLVRAALAWLRVLSTYAQGRSCTASELGDALLAGGCVAHIHEASFRATLDARLRRHGVIAWSETSFTNQLTERVPQLASAWTECMAMVRAFAGKQSLAAGSQHVRDVLQQLGFPGDSTPDSHTYQTLDALDQLIERLALQAPVTGEVSFSGVVSLLSQMAKETLFQPQRDPRSRLDVLGFLESEGGRWDGIWVLGLTDDVLPAVPQPNPLIPLAALRRVNAPRATPERELHWAQNMYRSILASADRVWLSHPAQDGERELRPSPCIVKLSADTVEHRHEPVRARALEYIVDDRGPLLAENEVSRGGIALIDAQARNPLWAFARFRLGAAQLPDYAIVTDRSVRGNFLHRAMEILWSMLRDQDALSERAVEHRLHVLVEQVTEQAADECLLEYGPVLRQLEVTRAQQILMRWLELEMQREPFAVVAVEQRQRWTHAGLDLSLQLDRIDRLADGRLAVIDYKSGANPPEPRHSWVRDRPVDLQLPLYAAVLSKNGQDVAVLVQASLHSRKTDTAGVSDGDCGLNGVSHFTSWDVFDGMSWRDVMARWQDAIQSIATEFAQGYAANVSTNPDDLKFCEVLPFLRLTEEYPSGDETAK